MTQMRAIYAAYFFVSILFEMVLNAKRPQTASSSESSLELPGSYAFSCTPHASDIGAGREEYTQMLQVVQTTHSHSGRVTFVYYLPRQTTQRETQLGYLPQRLLAFWKHQTC